MIITKFKIINRLKNNNDNIFVNSLIAVYDNDFTFTVNEHLYVIRKIDSLYQTVKSCKKFISKNAELNNTFQFISENQSFQVIHFVNSIFGLY